MTPKQRIVKLKRERCKHWIRDEGYVCPGCGESFRYIVNLSQHIKRCWDCKVKDGKQES